MYGPYVRVSKMRPYTGRKCGPYIRAVFTGTAYWALIYKWLKFDARFYDTFLGKSRVLQHDTIRYDTLQYIKTRAAEKLTAKQLSVL